LGMGGEERGSKGSFYKPSADLRWPDFPWRSAEGFCAH
jgi:hypothetical protein